MTSPGNIHETSPTSSYASLVVVHRYADRKLPDVLSLLCFKPLLLFVQPLLFTLQCSQTCLQKQTEPTCCEHLAFYPCILWRVTSVMHYDIYILWHVMCNTHYDRLLSCLRCMVTITPLSSFFLETILLAKCHHTHWRKTYRRFCVV